MQDLYANFLICQNDKACATHLAKLLDNRISHDQVTQFLNKKEFHSKDLWKYVKKNIAKIPKKKPCVLIIDDTISEKPHTKENPINCWHFDHSKGRCQKGINILTCVYSNGEINLPIGYEIIKKDEYYQDKKTGKQKRKSSITKNEHFRTLLLSANQNKVEYEYVLADSWFGSKANMNFIHSDLGKKFILGIKSNRLCKMYTKNPSDTYNYLQLRHSDLKADRPYLVKLKGIPYPLSLIKKVFKNGDGSVGTLYLASNDLKLNSSELYELCQKRWGIEVYHRGLKNNTSLSKSPARTVKRQSNHIYMSLLSYCKLEFLKLKTSFSNQYQLKERLLIKANQAAMNELIKLQNQIKMVA